MKTKISIAVLILIVLTGGWYLMRSRPQTENNQANNDSLLESNTASSSLSQSSTTTPNTAATPEDPALKAQAMKIIARPIVVKSALTEAAKKDIIEKIEGVKKEITQNYNQDTPWVMLGAYRKVLGDYDGAIEAWNFLTIIRPKGYLAFHNLGSLYGYELRNYPKSEQNFLKSIQNEPRNLDAYSQLVTVYETYNPTKIEPFLLSSIKSRPNEPLLKILLGQYYAKAGNKVEALKYLEEALKLDPNNTALKAEINQLK